MEAKTDRFYPSAPLEIIDLKQRKIYMMLIVLKTTSTTIKK